MPLPLSWILFWLVVLGILGTIFLFGYFCVMWRRTLAQKTEPQNYRAYITMGIASWIIIATLTLIPLYHYNFSFSILVALCSQIYIFFFGYMCAIRQTQNNPKPPRS